MTEDKKYDVVVFGGTGYTGEHVIREMFVTSDQEGVSWAIAGRSPAKMRCVLEKIANELSLDDFSGVGIVEADVDNLQSIAEMCRSAKLLINCVGPYYLWGRQVVEACLEGGTHYLDISGEPLFMEQMEADYNSRAVEEGLVVVSACGFDSIPADIGVRYAQLNFPGTLTAVESFLHPRVGQRGFSVHFPTFQCVVNGFSSRDRLVKFRRDRNLPRIPKMGRVLAPRGGVFREGGLFCAPFAGADRSVVMRTQRYLHEKEEGIPVQCGVYMSFQSTGLFIFLCCFGIIFLVLVSTSFGRKLLLKHPRIFTLGLVSREGATPDQIAQASFSITFKGYGYSGEVSGEPDRYITAEVSGPDPGYVSCSRFVCQAAYSVLKAGPRKVGVVTPGVALQTHDYIARLQTRGISFSHSIGDM